MDYLAAIGVLAAGALILAAIGLWLAWRWTWLLGWLKGCVISAFFVAAAGIGLLALDLGYWQQAREGQPVAHVSIERRPTDTAARLGLRIPGGGPEMSLSVTGDFVDIGLHTLYGRGSLRMLGTAYRPAYVRPRWDQIEQRRRQATAPAVEPLPYRASPVDLWAQLQYGWLKGRLQGLVRSDTTELNYLPLADGALFAIVFRRGQLVIEPLNDAARTASAF